MENRWRVSVWTMALVAILAGLPFVVTGSHGRFLLTQILLYALLAVSWNLTLGFGGIFNFAHIAFFAVGAYGAAIATTRWDISPWLGILVAAVAGVVASTVTFIPVIRLRGLYLCLVTYVFGQLCVYIVLSQRAVTGGSEGLTGLPRLHWGEYSFLQDGRLGYYYVAAALFIVSVGGVWWITRSSLGKGLQALRDNEEYALSIGLPAHRVRYAAFAVSAAIAGATGGLYALYFGVASPDLFGFGYMTLALCMVYLGGSGSVLGPALGAVAVTLLSDSLLTAGSWRPISTSILILLVLWFIPRGLAGGLSDVVSLWRRWRSSEAGDATKPDEGGSSPKDGMLASAGANGTAEADRQG